MPAKPLPQLNVNIIPRRIILLLCLPFLLLLPSCSRQFHKTYLVGFSQCTMVNKWRQTMLEEMQRELSFHPEIEFIVKDANGSTDKQISQIQSLIDDNIDLLIVSPNEAEPITPIVEKAYHHGISVIIVDRRTSSQNYSAYVGASNYQVGQDAAIFANSLLKGRGTVLEISDIPGSSADIDRHRGFEEFVEKIPGIHNLPKIYEKGDVDPSGDNLTTLLRSGATIDLIFAQNDRLAFSASKVCRQMGLEHKIKIIGVDGLLGPNGGIDLVERGILKATILYPTGGGEAILTAVSMLQKRPFSKEIRLPITVIDSSNVRIMKLQNEKLVALQKDIDRRQKKIEEQKAISNNQANIIVAISITLALALIFGGILFYYLLENKKINKKLEIQKNEISDQRNQLIELAEKVKEANDAKFKFFTNISHELRTPLTLILGPIEDALSSPKLHFTIRNNLEFVHRNALRLLRLINQLMDFRKIEESKMKLRASENNLSSFVIDIASSFRDIARKKSISFNVYNKAGDIKVWFEENLLDKVIFNLLSNAFKFTNDHGVISITIEKSADNRNAIIRVQDSGIGMSGEEIDHAFELFYQGHSASFNGTGLGLSLSKELINVHHGTINLKSEKNKGSTFEITLPLGTGHLQKEELLPEKPAAVGSYEDMKIYTAEIEPILQDQETARVATKEFSILIIEDNVDLINFLEIRLGEWYDIYKAQTGENGISMAYDIVPDLIISDIILPGQNGMQITQTLKEDIRTSHIPIILLTAKGSVQEQIAGIKVKADSFIVKPFNLEYLEETIKNLLKNRALLREHYTSELPMESRNPSSNKMDRKFINEFTAIVEKNISNEDLTVEDISREIGVSKVQLYRKVKALIGCNVNDYILSVRLQKAKFLLANEDLSIFEIAFRVGFATQAYFSTVFKSKFLVTPTEYRESKRRVKQ